MMHMLRNTEAAKGIYVKKKAENSSTPIAHILSENILSFLKSDLELNQSQK